MKKVDATLEDAFMQLIGETSSVNKEEENKEGGEE